MDLISLHVPKCAGSSLRSALVCAYGEHRIHFDNDDRLLDPKSLVNVDRPEFLRKFELNRDCALSGKCVVHGHFYIEKYRCLRAARVTILRHPVDRLISHYLFWNHQPAHGHSLHDQFLSEQPSIVQFARMPFLRHFYRQVLFRDVDMGMFDLIGNTENMDESVSQMEKVTGRKLWLETTNANTCKHCRKQRAKILKKESVLAELRDILADDIAFYERHARPG